MASKYNIGDLVWAKMKGFSPWPAKVVEPTKEVKRPTLKKPMQCVFFFGSDNYAWVLEDLIKPYVENKDKHLRQNKSGSFKEALEAIDDYARNRPKQPIKTADLPSIDEEIATIFPNGSNRSGPHRDYSRTPFLSKSKVKSEKESSKVNSMPKYKVHNEKVERKETHKKEIRRKDDIFGSSSMKRTSSDSSSASSMTNKRPRAVDKVVTPPLDVERVSETLRQKNIKASGLKFGFLGLGIMGRGIVKNLINSGHHVTVWNRTPSKCRDFVKAGAIKGQTPADVVAAADITFCCVSDPQAAKEMVFGNCGVLQEVRTKKGYVEMTSIDPETSQDIAEAILARGGRFLEAPLSGSKVPAEEGALIILAAGDRSLFNDCATCFQAMGKHAFYLGEVGNGSKMNLVINMVLGTALAGLAEAMALADRAGLSQRDLLEIMELGSLNCSAVIEKGKAIIEGTFPTNMPLQHMQKDLSLALGLSDQLEQPLPLTAAANESAKLV